MEMSLVIIKMLFQPFMTSSLPTGYVEEQWQTHFHCTKKKNDMDGDWKWKSPFVFHESRVSFEQHESE